MRNERKSRRPRKLSRQKGTEKMNTPVRNVAPGAPVKYRGREFVVLEQRAEGDLLLALEPVKSEFGGTNNYARSRLREYLDGPWLEELTDTPEEIVTRQVDLTALSGSKEYGTCDCRAAPLTLDEVRRYHAVLPDFRERIWSATPWGTFKPNADSDRVLIRDLLDGIDYKSSYEKGVTYPAVLLSGETAVEDGYDPLSRYSTGELVAEINRRINERGEGE